MSWCPGCSRDVEAPCHHFGCPLKRPAPMKLFTCTDHDGHYVGVASIVVAADEEAARKLLAAELPRHGLGAHGLSRDEPFTLTEIALGCAQAIVLQDGDY